LDKFRRVLSGLDWVQLVRQSLDAMEKVEVLVEEQFVPENEAQRFPVGPKTLALGEIH
jgi:hypothetical protein